MKKVLKLLLAVLAFSYVSCSSDKGNDASEFLTMDIGKSSGIIIPAPALTQSCEQIAKGDSGAGAVAGSYFTLPNPVFRWSLTESPLLSEVRIVALNFKLRSPKVGGEYNCVFSDTALKTLYYKRVSIPGTTEYEIHTWDALLGKNASVATSTQELRTNEGYSGCEIRCGGMTVPANAGQFSVTGTWELIGVQKKFVSADSIEYEEFPIKLQGNFTVENVLN